MSKNDLPLIKIEDVEREIYSRSFYEFFKKSFSVLERNTIFKDNWHYEYICGILQAEVERISRHEPSRYDVIIINVPPRSGKSYMVARTLNAWAWTRFPYMKFLTASYAEKLALSHSVDTRRLIESAWYQSLFSNVFRFAGDQNTKSRYDTNKGGMRLAVGTGGGSTGEGGDVIVVDDPMDPRRADSTVERENTNIWWDRTFFGRLNEPAVGLRVINMQRLHTQDQTGYVLEKGYRVLHICLPAKLSSEVNPPELAEKYKDGLLFPEVFSEKELEKQLISLGPYGFAGQIMQKPYPDGGGRIKRSWFTIIKRNQIPENLPKYTYTDPSEGKPNSDEMASGCWSIYQGRIIIWEVMSVVQPFNKFIGCRDETGRYVKSTYDHFLDRNGCDRTTYNFWEAKNLGQAYVDYINAHVPGVNAIGDNPGSESKEVRAFREIPTMFAGKVMLVEGEWNEAFLGQIESFPAGDEDGQVDVLASIIRKSDLAYEEEGETKNLENGEEEKEIHF